MVSWLGSFCDYSRIIIKTDAASDAHNIVRTMNSNAGEALGLAGGNCRCYRFINIWSNLIFMNFIKIDQVEQINIRLKYKKNQVRYVQRQSNQSNNKIPWVDIGSCDIF